MILAVSCSEDARTGEENVASSSATDTPVEVWLGQKGGALAGKALEATESTYESSDNLYWTYTAVKDDNYFKTGQVTDETALNTDEDGKGLPDKLPGTYSLGKWVFTFNAYTSADMSDLYYQGEETSVTLSSSGENTVSVNVQPAGDGTLVIQNLKVDSDSSDDEVTSIAYSHVVYVQVDDDEEVLVSSYTYDSDSGSFSLADGSSYDIEGVSESGSPYSVSLTAGYHTVTVTSYEDEDKSEATKASGSASIRIRPNLTTTITGSIDDSGSTVTLYLETDEEGETAVSNSSTVTLVYDAKDSNGNTYDVDSVVTTLYNGETYYVEADLEGYEVLYITDSDGNTVEEDSFTVTSDITLTARMGLLVDDITDIPGYSSVNLGYTTSDTTATAVEIDGGNYYIVEKWQDLWTTGSLTIKNVIFKLGLCISVNSTCTSEITLDIEDNTIYACDQEALIAATSSVYNRIDNSGDGLCLGIQTSTAGDGAEVNVTVSGNKLIGDNDATKDRSSYKSWSYVESGSRTDPRGRGVTLGNSSGTSANLGEAVISGNTFFGIRGSDIQLYTIPVDSSVTISGNDFQSWGINKQTQAGTKDDYAIRGELSTSTDDDGSTLTATLTLSGNTYATDWSDYDRDLSGYKVAVDNWNDDSSDSTGYDQTKAQ